jgi:hypothetical protein
MKINHAVIVVLSVITAWLAYLQLSRSGKPASEPPKDLWHTNAVEMWRTNAVVMWRTNTVEQWRTNTAVQNFTNEVVKEVPARLSPAAKEAATVGYKYLNAPVSANSSEALYKATPIAVDVSVNANDKGALARESDNIRKNVEEMLRSQGVQVDKSSPYHLKLTLTPAWMNDLPSVGLLTFKLEMKEKVALKRQGDVIQCDGVVWSTTGSKLIRTANLADELKSALGDQVEKFCSDYAKAKEKEKEVKSRMPTIPGDFLSGA